MAGFWWGFSEKFNPLQALSPILENLQEKINLQNEIRRREALFPIEFNQFLKELETKREFQREEALFEERLKQLPVDLQEHYQRTITGDPNDPKTQEAKETINQYFYYLNKLSLGQPLSESELEEAKKLPPITRSGLLLKNFDIIKWREAQRLQQEEIESLKSWRETQLAGREAALGIQAERLKLERERTEYQKQKDTITQLLGINQTLMGQYTSLSNQIISNSLRALDLKEQISKEKDKKKRASLQSQLAQIELEIENRKQKLQELGAQIDQLHSQLGMFLPISPETPEELQTPTKTGEQPEVPGLAQAVLQKDLDTSLKLCGFSDDIIESFQKKPQYQTIKKSWPNLSPDLKTVLLVSLINVRTK